jgi:uncharacterized Tic20 family protein
VSTGLTGGAPPGWYGTDQGWRWWDGHAWGPLAPPPVPEEESGKSMAILSHLGIILGGFILPLVIYCTEGKRNGFVRDHSREALNFQITFGILWIGGFVLFFVTMVATASVSRTGPPGVFFLVFPLMMGLWALGIVCSVLGAVRAGNGRRYRYPVSIRFVRG